MSYAICRVQKIKGASSVHGIQGHQRREWESKSNPDIDYSRINLNYSLIEEQNKSFNALADERIAQGYTGKTAIRKDAVKVVSALFTSDNEFFQGKTSEEQQKFFDDCYRWAGKRFGKDNIFSAVVHMDEATPHLHIEFVPLTADGRLSAKSLLGGRVELQRLQDDFYKAVGKPWGMERGERADLEDPNAQKPRKHLETAELKQKTAAEVRALEVKRDNLTAECTEIAQKHAEAEKEYKSLFGVKCALEEEIGALKSEKEDVGRDIDNAWEELEDLEAKIEDKKNFLQNETERLQNKIRKLENKLEDTNAEYDVAANQLKNVLDKKARASEIHKIFGDKETQTYHVNMLESTRAIGNKAYRDLQRAKEKLETAAKMKNQAERMSSEIKPLHEKATAELQQAQQLRQSQEQQIQRQVQILFEKKMKEAFKNAPDKRTQRLESLCEEVKFKDGKTVLDMFKERENILEQQIRRDYNNDIGGR